MRSRSLFIHFSGLFHSGTGFVQPPATPVIFSSASLSPSNSTTSTLSGLSDNGTTVRFYVSGSCQGTPSAVIGPILGDQVQRASGRWREQHQHVHCTSH